MSYVIDVYRGKVPAEKNIIDFGAFVVLFRVLAALMPAQIPGVVLGALEMVTGMAALEPGQAGFIAAAAMAGWGGLSVHCQAMSVAEGLRFRWHWVGKAVQAVISGVLAAGVWMLILPA